MNFTSLYIFLPHYVSQCKTCRKVSMCYETGRSPLCGGLVLSSWGLQLVRDRLYGVQYLLLSYIKISFSLFNGVELVCGILPLLYSNGSTLFNSSSTQSSRPYSSRSIRSMLEVINDFISEFTDKSCTQKKDCSLYNLLFSQQYF